jgi:hypothetical protein
MIARSDLNGANKDLREVVLYAQEQGWKGQKNTRGSIVLTAPDGSGARIVVSNNTRASHNLSALRRKIARHGLGTDVAVPALAAEQPAEPVVEPAEQPVPVEQSAKALPILQTRHGIGIEPRDVPGRGVLYYCQACGQESPTASGVATHIGWKHAIRVTRTEQEAPAPAAPVPAPAEPTPVPDAERTLAEIMRVLGVADRIQDLEARLADKQAQLDKALSALRAFRDLIADEIPD